MAERSDSPPDDPFSNPGLDLGGAAAVPSDAPLDRGSEPARHVTAEDGAPTSDQRDKSGREHRGTEAMAHEAIAHADGNATATTYKEPEVAWKQITLFWALIVLTPLIFVPVFVPALAAYCLAVLGQLLATAAGIMGLKYHYALRRPALQFSATGG
jgi:hypothetical protein